MLLLIGIGIFRDYGVSWDEKTQYKLGVEAVETLWHGKPWPEDPGRRFHGPVIEIVMTVVERLMHLKAARAIYFERHFINFLTFFAGVGFFYLLASKHFRNWRIGLLGALFLVLSPRIFGHAFVNSRDIPAMSLFIVAMFTLVRFREKRSLARAAVHALACALLIDVRMTGILLPPLTLGILLLDDWRRVRDGEKLSKLREASWICGYLVACMALVVLFWPLLWQHPVQNFLAAFQNMSTKGFGGYFMGEATATPVPYWLPVWIVISTPFLYTTFFLTGLGVLCLAFFRHPIRTALSRPDDLLFLLWFFVPIAAVIVLGAGIFDEWRHVYFIYPAFLLIALTGVKFLSDRAAKASLSWLQPAFVMVVSGSMILTAGWMFLNHPLQYVYFSIPSRLADGNFELDYWGLSYRQAYELILASDSDAVIPMIPSSSPGWSTVNILTPEQRRRILLVRDQKYAKYILDNFNDASYEKILDPEDKLASISAGNIEVLAIYGNVEWEPHDYGEKSPMPDTAMLFFEK